MGSALFIALEQEIPGFDPFVNGKVLADASDELDAAAAKLKVTPLMQYFSQDAEETASFLEGEGVEMDDFEIPPETWFPAADGLKTVEALLDHFEHMPNSPPQAVDIVRELQEFRTVLHRAADHEVRWHLDVDF
jgi:hypothetical protein